MNMQINDTKISDIQVSDRFRKDHGDLKELAQSITELGLLQPIGVTPDNRLVFGERRLKAVRDTAKHLMDTLWSVVTWINEDCNGSAGLIKSFVGMI